MLKQFIEGGNKSVVFLKRNRKIKPKGGIVKLNLGCGLSVAPGWINIDASLNALFAEWPAPVLNFLYRQAGAQRWYSKEQYIDILKDHVFLHHDLEYGIPFVDESVDYIYTSHWLEHLFLDQAERLLRDAYRVLKTGGRIRICVPDLEFAVTAYLRGEKEKAVSYFFSTSHAGRLGRHQYLYDYELLRGLLFEVGFGDAQRCSYREGKTPEIDQLDNRPDETLYVEATK